MIINNKFPFRFTSIELKHFDWMFNISPCFAVHSSKIKIINEPWSFYQRLCEKFGNASRRISIASLYIGTGELEQNLVKVIQNSIENKCVKLNVLLDYQRGTRGKVNSCTMLQNIVDKYPNYCDVYLYQTPRLNGSWSKLLPSRYNELVGVQHMKLYIADDTVLLSGANLSNDYFLQRQDRYIEIEDPDLAEFYSQLIEKVGCYSKRFYPGGDTKDNSYTKIYNTVKLKDKASPDFQGFINQWMETQKSKIIDSNSDTLIFPLLQMGDFGIRQDEQTMLCMIKSMPVNSNVRLATGYFNLTKDYANTLLDKMNVYFTLLMAHPNANGFLGASGPAGGIPYAYSLIAQSFAKKVMDSKRCSDISLREYERDAWTFHAKGLWYYPPGLCKPWATIVGSANLGERSVRRDLEAQAAIFTVSEDLQKKLDQEYALLHKYSSDCSEVLPQRKAPLWVRATVKFFKSFF